MVRAYAYHCNLLGVYPTVSKALDEYLDDDSEEVSGHLMTDKDGREIFVMKAPLH